jgi:uncharacterized DUF497 family protein
MIEFRWNAWNLDHATAHGVSTAEAVRVILNAARPYPRKHDGGKWIVKGRGNSGRMVQVIFVYDDDERQIVYVIHAMPVHGHRRKR